MENINEQIKELYLNQQLTTKQTAKQLDVAESTVIRRIKKLGIGRGKVKYRNRQDINNNYFETIDTPKKAYLLGFIYADGYNCTEKKSLRFKLHSDDYYIVEELAKEICGEVKYVNSGLNEGSPFHKFNITSTKLSDDLVKQGVPNRKDAIIEFPFHISEDLYSHFIKGYFDGDGCVTISKKNNTEYRKASICSHSYKMLHAVKNILESKNINSYIYKKGKGYDLCITDDYSITNFKNYIYKDSNIHLIRKHIKFHLSLVKKEIKKQSRFNYKHTQLVKNAFLQNPIENKTLFSSLKVWYKDIYLGDFGTFTNFCNIIDASHNSVYSSFLKKNSWKNHTFEYTKY
jgi:hypothetical protein